MIKLQSNCIKFQLSLITTSIDISISIKIGIPNQMDVLHYIHEPFTTTIILKPLFSNRNSQTLNLRNEYFKILKHWSLLTSIFHIYNPTIYNVNQKFKDSLKICQVISKSR